MVALLEEVVYRLSPTAFSPQPVYSRKPPSCAAAKVGSRESRAPLALADEVVEWASATVIVTKQPHSNEIS